MNQGSITITFVDQAENHKGMQIIGNPAREGFNYDDLCDCIKILEKRGISYELVDLTLKEYNNLEFAPAYVLIIKNGVDAFMVEGTAKSIFDEQRSLNWDSKAKMYGRVVNKKARYNLCYANESQEPDYDEGKGRIVAWKDIPITYLFKDIIKKIIGTKGEGLVAEGNYYYDVTKCGIGFHGDSERKKVVAIRLGERTPLHYQWYHEGKRIGERIKLELEHGDIYIMSEKAVGWDWKRRKITTLRHAAGSSRFLK